MVRAISRCSSHTAMAPAKAWQRSRWRVADAGSVSQRLGGKRRKVRFRASAVFGARVSTMKRILPLLRELGLASFAGHQTFPMPTQPELGGSSADLLFRESQDHAVS